MVALTNGKLKLVMWDINVNIIEDISVQDILFSLDVHLAGNLQFKNNSLNQNLSRLYDL